MEKKYIYYKGVTAAILLCLLLTSCGYTWTSGENINMTYVRNNVDFESVQIITPDIVTNVFYGGELEGVFPLGIARIENGVYTAIPRGGTRRGERIVIYDAEDGIVTEGRIHADPNSDFWRIIYDDFHERLLWTRHERHPVAQRTPDELIVLDMSLRELWRMNIPHYARSFEVMQDRLREPEHTPFYIMDVAITADFYYVVSINHIRQNSSVNHKVSVSPSSSAVTVVYKVDRDGNIVGVFRKENFEFLGMIIQDGFHITYGIRLVDGRAETIIIHGNSDNVFSGEYTIIQAKNRIRHVMIANDILLITGELVDAPRVRYFISLINLIDRDVMKTLDVSDIFDMYEILLYGIFYGAKREQVGIIGTSSWRGSRLGNEENSVIFIPISETFEVNSAFIIDIGAFRISQVREIHVCKNVLMLVCVSSYFYASDRTKGLYYSRQDVVEFSISHDRLTQLD